METKEFIPQVEEAIKLKGERKFKQTVELIFNFQGVEIEGAQKLNLNVQLPKGRGKEIEVGVFADGDMYVRAKKASKHVMTKTEMEEFASNKRKMRVYASQCYAFLAQADMMGVIGKSWGIVLGPRGKMPQPVPANANIEEVIKRAKNNVRIKTKKMPMIQAPVGTDDMSASDIAENIIAVFTAVERVIQKDNIRSLYVKTTMGEAVRIW
jgi:large subunit ribosomal protein L1